MQRIETTTTVAASPEAVWETLVDFDRYSEWNPLLQVSGRPNPGAHLLVDMQLPDRRPMQFRPTVVAADRGRELRWLGHLLVPGLYDGEHEFRLAPDGEGGTRLVHAETFRGLLVPVVNRFLGGSIERGFAGMNAALKARVEATAGGPAARSDRTTSGTDAAGD
jgi:hypothetical protein